MLSATRLVSSSVCRNGCVACEAKLNGIRSTGRFATFSQPRGLVMMSR